MQTRNFNVYDEDNKAVQEAYALLTANLHFSNSASPMKTLAIASFGPNVGRTTVAINLAISMAKSGRQTLLLDTDMRKPRKVKRLSNNEIHGFSEVVEGKIEMTDVMHNTNITNLTYLSCGENIINPIEILCSSKFEKFISDMKEKFDFIILDTPTLSSVIDGALVASKVDATLIVAEMGVTKLTDLDRAKEQLKKANANIIGVVLNKVKKHDYQKYVQAYNYFFDTRRFEKRKRSKRAQKFEAKLGTEQDTKIYEL